jgi:hypothetical protein
MVRVVLFALCLLAVGRALIAACARRRGGYFAATNP